jgi:sec-independent protein translocase protein TatA
MGLFREPWVIILIVVLVLLLFAAPKLPAFAKSLGQSMRIFRKEVKTMKDEKAADTEAPTAGANAVVESTAAAESDDSKPSA